MKSAIWLILILAIAACANGNTDDTTDNGVNNDNSDLEVPDRPSPNNYFCEDSDNGVDILTKGTVKSDQGVFTDTCQDNYKLREYSCSGDTATSSERRCAQGPCVDGACTIEEEESACTDTDGGIYYDKLGTATGIRGDAKADYCEGGVLYEAYCDYLDISQYKEFICDVCEAGVCVQERLNTEFEGCVDTDGGSWYEIKGTTSDATGTEETDTCLTEKILEEFYCNTYGVVGSKTTRCSCLDGACVADIS